jgi:hypothetical protein
MPASRSLIALLVGTVVFFALWVIALKPSSSNHQNAKSQGLGAFQSDINAAHHAVGTANANQAASAGEKPSTSSSSSRASASTKPSKSAPTTKSTTADKHPTTSTSKSSSKTKASSSVTPVPQATPASELSMIKAALTDHKAVALLFYNPAAADDQAVKQEMSSVPTHRGQVVKLEVPANEAGNFTSVTQQVPVNLTPTLVLISRGGDASEIVGYGDAFEIDQRVADALAGS